MADFQTEQAFSTRENLKEWVDNVARTLGYVVNTKRSKTKGSGSGYVSKVVLVCDRSGVYRGTNTSGRNTGTKKIDCPFELVGIYYKTHDFWLLKVINGEHNHDPAMYMEGHAFAKRLTKDEYRLVGDLTDNNVPPRNILSTLKSRNEHNVSTIDTVYNAREKYRKQMRAGRSEMQVVFEILQSKGYIYEFHKDDATNELEDLFFVHQTSLNIWRTFPQVLMMDATYKTNKYNMPLLEIVGVTSTNNTFSIAFAFMDEEKEANYVWALKCLRSTLDGYDGPYVIVTDRELALMNACANVFPASNRLLCRWHIFEAIKKNCKSRLKSKGIWESCKKAWNKLINSSTRRSYSENYAQLQLLLEDCPDSCNYLNRTWLDKYKEMFVSLWTDTILHFHNHTNNRVESQHAKLKNYLDSNHSKLDKFFEHIEKTVESQYTAIKGRLEKSRIELKHFHGIDFFKYLQHEVSHHGLQKILLEFDRLNFQNITEANCGCQLRRSCGLPCAHEILVYSNAGQRIPLESVDSFWRRLRLDTVVPVTRYDESHFDGEADILKKSYIKQSNDVKASYITKMKNIWKSSTTMASDPVVRTNTRGRPKASTKPSQAKNLVQPTQHSSTQDPRRRSFSTYTPDYNTFDLNQQPEPERHSTYSFREPSMFNQEPVYQRSYFDHSLTSEISSEFQPYVSRIENVNGDGHCGLRSIAVALGFGQEYWPQIRSDLYEELLMHFEDYKEVFENDTDGIREGLNYYVTPAIRKYWLIMPDTGILIANKYSVIVHFLSNQGSSTCFPLWRGPQDYPTHPIINIAHVHGNHYVKVDLQEGHPLAPVVWLWDNHRSARSAGWKTLYNARLNAYVPPYKPTNNCSPQFFNVPSDN